MMKRNACNYSQHLPGRSNVIAYLLSLDFHLTYDQLIPMLTSLHPFLSPPKNQDCPLSSEVYLLGCDYVARMARDKGVTKATHQKRNHSWSIWLDFLDRYKLKDNPYLEGVEEGRRLRICGAFMHAVR